MQCQIKLELQRLDGALSASFLTLNLAIFYIIAWQAWFKEQNNSVSSSEKLTCVSYPMKVICMAKKY